MDAGKQSVSPHEAYPGADHPEPYLFDTNGRRTLEEYQLVVLQSGRGSFASRSCPECSVQAGQAFVLFPGEWHRYRPDPETGWTETWIGFNGREADRIMESFFERRHPVVDISHPDELSRHLNRLLGLLQDELSPGEPVLASHIPLALALTGIGQNRGSPQQGRDGDLVTRAKAAMASAIGTRTDLPALARELGASYSRFRFTFKEQTGFSPREFENRLRLNRARDLLRQEGMTVTETAHALGYTNVYYFSAAFKKQFGLPPSTWRKGQAERERPRS
jgi:AraC-like DNA-binding protein